MGFDARVSTEHDIPLPESACVYCGNCIGVCPTNALQFKTEFDLRSAANWRPEDQEVTETICSFCGVGCTLELHTQDTEIVKVTSPADHSVTSGHLCVKGRFGWEYVQAPCMTVRRYKWMPQLTTDESMTFHPWFSETSVRRHQLVTKSLTA